MIYMKFNLSLLIIFTLLQIADIWTTYLNLERPDRAESNPFLKAIMDKIGIIPTLLLSKITVIFLFIFAYLFADSIYLTIALACLCVFYAVVVFKNYRLMKV
jgi:uncharacterized protein YacL